MAFRKEKCISCDGTGEWEVEVDSGYGSVYVTTETCGRCKGSGATYGLCDTCNEPLNVYGYCVQCQKKDKDAP